MIRKFLALTAATLLAAGLSIATPSADAMDTGWDCKGCRVHR